MNRLLASAALAASVLIPACIHWPDAPYVDAVASLSPEAAERLEVAHPGASLTGRVYRTHMEERGGRYRVVRQRFLFEDAAGRRFRGVVDREGRLSVSPVTMVDALPDDLHTAFFGTEPAEAGEGRLSGRAWRFVDPVTKETWYEFEFVIGERRGLGGIDESGRFRNAEDFARPTD
jgi:hypothetical protein